jgi:3-hydroxyacyl-CoA dehydrogenase/enoyl-CoA hydratase/3-hydroxybutyryl-CoA epimerase
MNTKHWHLDIDEDNIGWLHFDKQSASSNVLNGETLAELDHVLDTLLSSLPAGLVVLSDKPAGFIAGADVHSFQGLRNRRDALELIQYAHKIFAKLASLVCPKVALVHGYCLGGGLELALCCDYILGRDDEHTHFGLPEVKLGIHPGFGGTVRAIQRLGAVKALPLMLTGRTLSVRSALKLGLIDEIIPERHFRNAARRYVYAQPKQQRAPMWERLFHFAPVRRLLGNILKKKIHQKANPQHYPAPYALIDVWLKHASNIPAMYRERLKAFGKIDNASRISHVHVIGAGVMGGDIASWCALRGLKVTLQDANLPAIAASMKRAHSLFKHKLKTPLRLRASMDRLIADPHGDGVGSADVIIEAIFENLEAKQNLFAGVEARARHDALLATNTSSLPLEDIATVLTTPSRLVGLHFFNPVAQMPLLEVVYANTTDPASQAQAAGFAVQIGKLPLPVKSAPGFLVNRVLMPYLLEAVTMVEEGVPAQGPGWTGYLLFGRRDPRTKARPSRSGKSEIHVG